MTMHERREPYPARERHSFFSQRFIRLLTKTAAANEIGTDAFALLCIIAAQEDAKRYTEAVTYWNEQLMPLCGFGSPKRLAAARKRAVAAGWLHYERGTKAKVGRYWVLIPAEYQNVRDGYCDESDGRFLSDSEGKAESNREIPFRNGKETGERSQDSIPNRPPIGKGNRPTSIPNPIPGRNPDSDQMNKTFEAALPLALRAWRALRPTKPNDRQLIARAAVLGVTKLSEQWFNDSLGGVTQCRSDKPCGKFRTCCREKASPQDFDELESQVKIPKTFYKRIEAELRRKPQAAAILRSVPDSESLNARRAELDRQLHAEAKRQAS
jgi:hypothetical protein